jgi:flagellar biosynthesis protein
LVVGSVSDEDHDSRNDVEKSGAADGREAPARRAKAVALKDSSASGAMPRVIASGTGGVAEQILQIAWANDIKVREDADLVEVLAAIDVDSEIPIEAFAAVAEILAYVYAANNEAPPPGSSATEIAR